MTNHRSKVGIFPEWHGGLKQESLFYVTNNHNMKNWTFYLEVKQKKINPNDFFKELQIIFNYFEVIRYRPIPFIK